MWLLTYWTAFSGENMEKTGVKYEAFPAWAIVKEALLFRYYNATKMLTRFKKRPSPRHWEQFQDAVVEWWIDMRPHLQHLRKVDTDSLIWLNTQLLKSTEKDKKLWVNAFNELQLALHELGVTKIAMPMDDLPEEHVAVLGHPALRDLAYNIPSIKTLMRSKKRK